jgi:hypothetical protein
MTMSRFAKWMAGLLGAWFAFSFAASALHLYQTRPDQPPLPIGLAAAIPVIVFLVWRRASVRFRAFTANLDARVLSLVQSWRVGGFVFLALAANGILPWMFALPAGLGDMMIGATAWWAALRLGRGARRRGFIAWQLFGIADLVTAVLLGTLARFIDPHGVSMNAMTVLPMSLIPTFAVPLLLIFHLIAIAQARQWTADGAGSLEQPLSFAPKGAA